VGPLDISDSKLDAAAGPYVALVRPHELEIGAAGDGWAASIVAIRVIGPIVRIDLCAEGQSIHEPLEAEISRERFAAEGFHLSQKVGVKFRRWQVYPSVTAGVRGVPA
jgi:TOBE-like domain